MSKMNGIWCNKDATIGIVAQYYIAFLRLEEDCIVSILKHKEYGTVGVVYGKGKNYNATSVFCGKNCDNNELIYNDIEAKQHFENHCNDEIEFNEEENKIIYKTYNNITFEFVLAEKIDMEQMKKIEPINNNISIAERAKLWNIRENFYYNEDGFNVVIESENYGIVFSFSKCVNTAYCRVGKKDYCNKGYAMLSTTCLRLNECRMIEDNMKLIDKFKANEEFFVSNGCAFPNDGGWYWSVKDVTDDYILFNGCNGDEYVLKRTK